MDASFRRGDLLKARGIAEGMVEIADREESNILAIQAHFVLGDTLFWLGCFREALSSFERAIAGEAAAPDITRNAYPWDSVGFSLAYSALCLLWHLGQLGSDLVRNSQAARHASGKQYPANRATV